MTWLTIYLITSALIASGLTAGNFIESQKRLSTPEALAGFYIIAVLVWIGTFLLWVPGLIVLSIVLLTHVLVNKPFKR